MLEQTQSGNTVEDRVASPMSSSSADSELSTRSNDTSGPSAVLPTPKDLLESAPAMKGEILQGRYISPWIDQGGKHEGGESSQSAKGRSRSQGVLPTPEDCLEELAKRNPSERNAQRQMTGQSPRVQRGFANVSRRSSITGQRFPSGTCYCGARSTRAF